MEWVETTGRTIAEALDAALDELGVDEDDVEYEVLEEPKSGFLGRLGEQRGPDPRPGEADLAGEAGGAPAPQPAPWIRPAAVGGSGRRTAAAATAARSDAASGAGERRAGRRPAERRRRGRRTGAAVGRSRRRRRRGRRHARERQAEPGRPHGAGDERDEQQGSTVETIEHDVPIEEQAEAAEDVHPGSGRRLRPRRAGPRA